MRSWPSGLLLALGVILVGCGNDRAYDCGTSALTYETFGAPFMANWCRGCHSAQLIPSMRQNAPLDINYDTLDEVRSTRARILAVTVDGATMPPRGGPSDEERELLRSWLGCGAP